MKFSISEIFSSKLTLKTYLSKDNFKICILPLLKKAWKALFNNNNYISISRIM